MPATNLERYKRDLAELRKLGGKMDIDLALRLKKQQKNTLSDTEKPLAKEHGGSFDRDYQRWYTEALAVVRQLLPDRTEEFVSLYQTDPRRKVVDHASFTIQDWLRGLRGSVDASTGERRILDIEAVLGRFMTQTAILEAAERRFESSLFDIRQIVQAELFDSEVMAARELLKSGFLRAAGVVAGVVLEKHLAEVCSNHSIVVKKANPGISDHNELLKGGDVLDVAAWRFNQRLADIRNLCGHNKEREPTASEVAELIDGVEKVTKTLF